MHCFTDGSQEAQNVLDYFPNAYFGFTGVVTYKSSGKISDAVRDVIPLNRILLETDAPYMVPDGVGGKVSHPGMCVQTAKFLARLKGVSTDELMNTCRENTRQMYSI